MNQGGMVAQTFVALIVPETKGRSLGQIEAVLDTAPALFGQAGTP